LVHDVADTFLYDAKTLKETEDMFDQIKFYNEIELNIKLAKYLDKCKQLSGILAPIVTFDNNRTD
jgi:hypothetical protein